MAQAASEGLVGYDDIRLPPLLRVGDLVESVPGMVATQHSGTGKANQYFLRGFNLDHGTDFSGSAEGVPLNLRSHGHGQGYLDLNFLIPELVATSVYRKGPYSAASGDFSSAGSVEFQFYERLPDTLLTATLGEDGFRRALGAGSTDTGNGVITAALDATGYDGPWQLEEDLSQYKLHLSYGADLGAARARVTFQGYDSQWNATDQIPGRAVAAGLVDRLGHIDPDLGGQTRRHALTAALELPFWTATAYLVDYDFTLFSNFTYLLEDPERGDEFEQRDERTVYGLALRGNTDRRLDDPLQLGWGADLRHDDIDGVGLYRTSARQRVGTLREDAVAQFSAAVFGEAEWHFTRKLRGSAGLRADHYRWNVDAYRPVNGGTGSDTLISPKLNLAYRFSAGAEGYLNWGRGFHSNDVRGATIRIDPVSSEPVDPVDVLVASEGAEAGVRFEQGERFNLSLVAFWLALDSELVFVGDAGTAEPNDGTSRTGFEAAAFWQAAPWLALDTTYTVTDARFRSDQGGGREIPGAVPSTFSLGANAAWRNGLSASLRLRYLKDAPLVEDNSVRADDSLLVNGALAYRAQRYELRLDAFNLLDSRDHDISYFYASRLQGEPAGGVEDVHFHPLEPRALRLSLTRRW